jgi:hypothetical protein
MKTIWGAALCALALVSGPPAGAAIYEITVTGRLSQQLASGTQPGFDVGDVFMVTTRFDSSRISPQAGGVQNVNLWPLPTTGPEFWRMDAEGFTWQSQDDYLDGLGGPAIQLSGRRVVGMQAALVPTGSTAVPFVRLAPGATFTVEPGGNLYGNSSDPGWFVGAWDFAGATVLIDGVAVPEPAAWTTMLIGFLGLGLAVRRRRTALGA